MFSDDFIISYVRTDNSKKYVILMGTREDFKARQRSVNMNGDKYPGLKFSSYKELVRNQSKLTNICRLNTLSKL